MNVKWPKQIIIWDGKSNKIDEYVKGHVNKCSRALVKHPKMKKKKSALKTSLF